MIDPQVVKISTNIGGKVFQKSVKPGLISSLDEDLCDRLLQLDHENLVKIYKYKQLEDGTFIFELEYCEFKSLAEILGNRNVDVEFVNDLIFGVLQGLIYLHKSGFVHGDIKPSNILVAREKKSLMFKLGDLDTIKSNPSEFTKAGFYTPEILPPECYLDGIMSDKVDIWSFGVLLFKLFTGEYPFGHRNEFSYEEIMGFASNAAYRNYTPKDIPEPYGTFISYCLTFDPKLRPSAKALLNMLVLP